MVDVAVPAVPRVYLLAKKDLHRGEPFQALGHCLREPPQVSAVGVRSAQEWSPYFLLLRSLARVHLTEPTQARM